MWLADSATTSGGSLSQRRPSLLGRNLMIQRMRAKKGEESGFTLIELLIVIIILAILAAIVVFAIGTTRKDSVASSCRTDAKSIELSLEAVNTKTGAYPTNQTGAVSPATGALLKQWPSSSDYSFAYAPNGSGYTVTVNPGGNTFTDASTGTDDIATACNAI